jgi:hypothetical protein
MSSPRDPTQFTRESAERIANVVRAAEFASPAARPLNFERVDVAQKAKLFRVCTFDGAWPVGSSKTVTLKGSAVTVVAVNLFCGLSPGTVTCDVSIAKDGTTWYLVQPNVTQLPGYSASGTQVMVIVSGNLQFIGTTAC